MMRLVSLVPSATETLLAWNIEPVAVTRFCEQGVRFPTVGGTKDPDLHTIIAASPDLVVMCDQENRKEDADSLIAAGLAVHVIHITSIDHVGLEMSRLAAALDVNESLGTACGAEQALLGEWEGLTPIPSPGLCADSGLGSGEQQAQKDFPVFVPIWRKPWMTINNDTYGGSLLRAAGYTNIFGNLGERYPTVDSAAILDRHPRAVLAPSEPYPFTNRQRAELEIFAPVYFVDGKDLFWWGVRTPAALQRIRLPHVHSG
jgi:ABC-type Fe3+-hydroxamate transport system substrate-binding protein